MQMYDCGFTFQTAIAGGIPGRHDPGNGSQSLGIAAHNIPPLSRAGLLKPLGRPGRYCIKRFSRDLLARNLADATWLEKAMAAYHRHWRIKNARKRVNKAKGMPASESVAR